MHPILDEICRAHQPPTRIDVFRRWQNELKNSVQPLLDELERLKAEKPEKKERVPA